MNLTIKNQEVYSRGELMLRFFFGWLYIVGPHIFLLFFVSLWGAILQFIAWWTILFTGRYPQSFFEFQIGLIRWNIRLNARMLNLTDGYPSFGINGSDEYTSFEATYPEKLSRGLLLLKTFFGIFYVMLPHGFILYFRTLWGMILAFLAFWAVLFTGKYPESWHTFNVNTIRWGTRVNLYLTFLSDEYPPFTGK